MRGLDKWRHAEGVPHACTASPGPSQSSKIDMPPSLTGLQHRAEGVLQAAIPRPYFLTNFISDNRYKPNSTGWAGGIECAAIIYLQPSENGTFERHHQIK